MKRRHVWIGAGVLFVVLVGSGFVPDLRFNADFREAKAQGLTSTERAPLIPASEDAAPLYRTAASKFAPIPMQLLGDYAGQITLPTNQLKRYLAAMSVAAEKPACSTLDSGKEYEAANSTGLNLFNAAHATVDLAKDESNLLASARMAKHLSDQRTVAATGRWVFLVNAVLTKAKKLNLPEESRARLRAAFGPPLEAREILHRHVAKTVEEIEKNVKENGRRLSQTRKESAYLHFWTTFFKQHPTSGPTFTAAIGQADADIQGAEAMGGQFIEISGVTGTTTRPWAAWAEGIEKANKQLAGG